MHLSLFQAFLSLSRKAVEKPMFLTQVPRSRSTFLNLLCNQMKKNKNRAIRKSSTILPQRNTCLTTNVDTATNPPQQTENLPLTESLTKTSLNPTSLSMRTFLRKQGPTIPEFPQEHNLANQVQTLKYLFFQLQEKRGKRYETRKRRQAKEWGLQSCRDK